MTAILNFAGTFLSLHPPFTSSPPVIATPLDTSDLTPTLTWSRWGGDPVDHSVLYDVVVTQDGTPVSLTGAADIDGTSYTVAPALTEGVTYDITVAAKVDGSVVSTSAAVTFIKPVEGDSLGLIQSAAMKYSFMRERDGHFYMQHTASPGGFTTLTDVNLAASTYHVATGMRGQPIPRTLVDYAVDAVYMGTDDPNCQLWLYTPSTGAAEKVYEAPFGSRPFRLACIAPDGQLWFGSVTNAFVSRYDPQTDTFESYPTLQANRNYVYHLWVDGTNPSTYNIVGVLSYEPWVLFVFNPRTEAATLYHTTDGDIGGTLYARNSDGALLYRRNLAGGGIAWESIIGGVVSSISTPANGTYTPVNQLSLGFSQTPANWAYDVNTAQASPTDITPARVSFKLKAASVYTDLDIDGITTSVVEPFQAVPFDADTFAIIGEGYVPPYFWTPDTDARALGGFALASWYAVLVDGTEVYLAGYDNWVALYDRTQPWTLTPDSTSPTTTNPRKLTGTSGQWHYYAGKRGSGNDREIWTAAKSSRGNVSEHHIYLNRYVPNTGVMTAFDISPGSTVVTGMVISTEGIVVALTESGVGKIKIINPSTGALIREYTTLNADPGLLVKLSETEVLCIENFRYSKRNIVTGATDYAFTTSGKLCGATTYTYDRRAELHGSEVRLQVGNVMNSLNAANGALTPIAGGSSTPKTVPWLGSTAYAMNINGFEENA